MFMMKNKNLICRLFGLVGIAFICGVLFQFIQVVVFDTFGISLYTLKYYKEDNMKVYINLKEAKE